MYTNVTIQCLVPHMYQEKLCDQSTGKVIIKTVFKNQTVFGFYSNDKIGELHILKYINI